MKWIPYTHKITFEIDGSDIKFFSDDERYKDRDARELYDEILEEHREMNIVKEEEERLLEIENNK